ncbi:MAG: MFS transporter [Chloroflexota bacterium]
MTAPASRIRVDPILALPEFRALLLARLLSALGMTAITTVVAFQTYQLTNDPLSLGLLGLVEAIPALGLMLIGGHVADRRDRRSIVLITGAMLTVGALALTLMALNANALGLIGILAVVFVVGIASGFERPALTAFETQVIPIAFASRGVSWTSATWTTASIIGPAAGGIAIAIIGLPATYAVITVLLGVSVWAVTRIAPKPVPEPEVKEDFVESLSAGVRYVRNHQVLLGSMALDLFAVFFGGAIAMLPVFASDILHVGPAGLGILRTAPSIGALTAMLATTRFPPRRRAGMVLLTAVTAFGISMIVFGLSTVFWISLVALFASGLADGVSVVIRILILRVESPEAMRGRVASVNYLFIGASNELGAFESGMAATFFGVIPSVVGGGILTLIVVGATAILAPQLRHLDMGRRLVEGPGASPQGGAIPAAQTAAEIERVAGGELGGEGASIQG